MRAYYSRSYTYDRKYYFTLSSPTILSMTSRCGFEQGPKSNGRNQRNSHLTRTLSFGSSTMHLSHFSNSPTSGTPCIISAVELISQLQKHCDDDQFDLIGRHSKLRVISDRARHYLLWKLRRLGRKRKWINALPRTKKPRRQKGNRIVRQWPRLFPEREALNDFDLGDQNRLPIRSTSRKPFRLSCS